MAVQSAAGAKLFIGPQNDVANDQAAYEALSFTLVGEVENIGEFGDAFSEITFTALNDRRTRKLKGSKNAGTLPITVGFDSGDAGQAALKAALASDLDYAVRVELQDSTTGSPANPETFYLRGLIMSRVVNIGDAESIVRANISIGINSDVIEVAAVGD